MMTITGRVMFFFACDCPISSRELPPSVFVVVFLCHIWWLGRWKQRRPRGVLRFCYECSGTIRPCKSKAVHSASLQTMLDRVSYCSWRQGGGMVDVQAWLVVVSRLSVQGVLGWREGGEVHQGLEHCYRGNNAKTV